MTNDPARPALTQTAVATHPLRGASLGRWYDQPPVQTGPDGSRTWITRGANFVVTYTEAVPGTELGRDDNPDEWMVILGPGVGATIAAGPDKVEAEGDSLSILPPGAATVTARTAGLIVRLFSSQAADLTALADNAGAYADGAPEVAPIQPWPEPVGGFKLRHYRLNDYNDPKLFGRLFRSTNLMVNYVEPLKAPRDPARLSPHSHEDFEQGSLAIAGTFFHHMRYPWSPDSRTWRADQHEEFASPSLLVIPAQVIHTTRYAGGDTGLFVDIFAPPRRDFSLMPGLVRNADEYPMPL